MKWFMVEDIKPDEYLHPNNGKRDRWNGYIHQAVVEEYAKMEMAKRQLKADRLQSELMEGKLSETSIKVCMYVCVESLACTLRVPPVTYGVYPSSFSPVLICCEYPPNTMPPVHPAENGYLEFPGCQIKLALSPISVVVQVGLRVLSPPVSS